LKDHKSKQGLETLLELNGEVFPMENGYWTRIEARVVEPTNQQLYGIKYSLTLHDSYNQRVQRVNQQS